MLSKINNHRRTVPVQVLPINRHQKNTTKTDRKHNTVKTGMSYKGRDKLFSKRILSIIKKDLQTPLNGHFGSPNPKRNPLIKFNGQFKKRGTKTR